MIKRLFMITALGAALVACSPAGSTTAPGATSGSSVAPVDSAAPSEAVESAAPSEAVESAAPSEGASPSS